MTDEQTSRLPSPQTTLVILLGASEWPRDPDDFPAHKAFQAAAEQIYRYFVQSFGIPRGNVLQLFNSNLNANAIDERIYHHLERFKGQARDVIVYYIGRGEQTYANQLYLTIRKTREDNPEGTSLQITSLAKTVLAQARTMRRFYILDCGFAARAIQGLQGIAQVDLLFGSIEEAERGTHGYTGLFSSGMSDDAAILPDDTNTFFTEALLQVLSAGNANSDKPLSFYDVYTVINATMNALHQKYLSTHPETQEPPRVQMYPGDITNIPILPKSKPSSGRFLLPLPAAADRSFPPLRRLWFLAITFIVLVLVASVSVLHPWAVSPKRGTLLLAYGGHTGNVDSVAWSPDGQQIATASEDDTMQVWNANTGATQKIHRYGHGSYAITWLPTGTFIAFASDFVSNNTDPTTIQVWNADTNRIRFTWTAQTTAQQVTDGFHYSQLAWSPDGKYLAIVGSANGYLWVALSVLDVAKKTLLFTQPVKNSFIERIAWSPDGTRIAYTDSGDNNIQVINATTSQHLSQYDPSPHFKSDEGVSGLAWSPDGKYLAAGMSNGTPSALNGQVHICDAQTGKIVYTYSGHTAGVTAIVWSLDGKHIASADATHIHVWEAFTGHDPYIYDNQSGQILGLAWSPDSTRIASVGTSNVDGNGLGKAVVWQAV
jgi:WD40 repeat protein